MAVVGSIIQVMAPRSEVPRADPGVITSTGAPSSYENIPVLRFDGSNVETYDMLCALEGYQGGSLVLSVAWCTAVAPDGTSDWEVGIRRLSTGENLDNGHDYNTSTTSVTLPQAAASFRQVNYTDWTLTSIDGLQDQERFIIRLNRNPPDNQTDDIEILWPAIVIREA